MTAPVVNSTETKPRSRRALLAGALGGLGAWAATAIGRSSPVRAEGQAMVVGGDYADATSTTSLTNQANNASVFRAESAGSGDGVVGISLGGAGVAGLSQSSYGVYGKSYDQSAGVGWSEFGTGLLGFSGVGAIPAVKPLTGVYGEANHDANSRGVWGKSGPGKGVQGQATGGTGVHGSSQSGWGVYGTSFYDVGVAGNSSASDMPAVRGRAAGNSTGVLGFSGVSAQPPAPALTGVYGYAVGRGSAGVRGDTTVGLGVRALATTGTAVLAESESGMALHTIGRLKVHKVSGVATIPAGSTSTTITPGVEITADSFVLLTPRANIGSRALWFTTNAADDKFTIRMSSTRSSNTPVAWLLLG